MKARFLTLHAIILLGIALLCMPAFSATEEDCKCHDRPDTPCVRQRIVLEDVVFESRRFRGQDNQAHDELIESGHSEVWLLIETVPSGACRACAQTYILYAPRRWVESDRTYHLFTPSGDSLTHSKVVFSMTECSEASPLSMRVAIIEEDDSYSDSLAFLSLFLSKGLLLGETGDRTASEAEAKGWSARLDGAWLDSLVDRLQLDDDNEIVLPATAVGAVSMDGNPTTTDVGESSGLLPRWVQLKVRGDSYPIGCDLRCGEDDAPTQAESHFAGTKLCDLAAFVATAKPGYSEVSGGSGLPANAVKQETSVKKETRTGSDGSKVEYVFVTRVTRFRDGSVYVESYSIKRVIGPDGKAKETFRDCLQGTSLRGFDRAKIRSLLEVSEQMSTTQTLSGGSPSAALCAFSPVDATDGIAAVPNVLTIIVPSNAVLDLASSADAADVVGPRLLALDSVVIHTDEILFPEGSTLETMIYPAPQVFPSEDRLLLLAPEAAAVACSGDRIDFVLGNLSGAIASVSVTASDTRGWTVPIEQEIRLSAGEVTTIALHVEDGETAAMYATSTLSITANAAGLSHTTRVVELRCAEDGDAPPPETAETTAVTVWGPEAPMTEPALSIPEDIEANARLLAWKGGQLGRTDPSQRWEASEDDPGEYCEPCGHTPMCVVCMEWDLQEWQLHRDKSLTDVFALMAVLSYLAQVSGQPEYYALASIYWDAHWDGWGNRNRPW